MSSLLPGLHLTSMAEMMKTKGNRTRQHCVFGGDFIGIKHIHFLVWLKQNLETFLKGQ